MLKHDVCTIKNISHDLSKISTLDKLLDISLLGEKKQQEPFSTSIWWWEVGKSTPLSTAIMQALTCYLHIQVTKHEPITEPITNRSCLSKAGNSALFHSSAQYKETTNPLT